MGLGYRGVVPCGLSVFIITCLINLKRLIKVQRANLRSVFIMWEHLSSMRGKKWLVSLVTVVMTTPMQL